MQKLRSILSAWQPGTAAAADPLAQIRSQWATIVGEEIAANSRPAEFHGASLLVVTRSSAWSQQLSFLSEEVMNSVRAATDQPLERVRFRVGRIATRAHAPQRRKGLTPKAAASREPAATLESAFALFRETVQKAQRAKAGAGWKECNRCGTRIVPSLGELCAPCGNARSAERSATIARLLFEVPFLGYTGIAEHVEKLSRSEYETVRSKLLASWWDTLTQLRRSGRSRVSRRERDIASSYVLLKTGLDPEQIAPAVVRDLLGDDLYNLFYVDGNE